MRRVGVSGLAVISLLAFTGLAGAAPDSSKVQSERARPSPGGSSAPEAGMGRDTAAASDSAAALEDRFGLAQKRIWSITAGIETHVSIFQNSLNFADRDKQTKLYNYYFITPQVFVTPHDQLRAELGVTQGFIADAGETGARLTDFSLSYTRYIPILTESGIAPPTPPLKGLLLRISASATAPTSFASQLRGLVTVPRLRIFAEKAFLDRTLVATASTFGEYYVQRFRSAPGGSPNAQFRAAVEASLDYFLPFHRQLSIGVSGASSWVGYFDIDTTTVLGNGLLGDGTFKHQPTQQTYSAQVDLRYLLPKFIGIRATLGLTYALGDLSVLHDGVQHLYFPFYIRGSEIYGTLTARL